MIVMVSVLVGEEDGVEQMAVVDGVGSDGRVEWNVASGNIVWKTRVQRVVG